MDGLASSPLGIKAQAVFRSRYGHPPEVIVHAPGRINLIGEHTDYNHGFVLPAAIPQGVCIAMSKHPGPNHEWYAIDTDDPATIPWTRTSATGGGWTDFFLGAFLLVTSGHDRRSAIRCVFTADLPPGAGLSSSSALTCGFLLGLNALLGLGKTREELAWLAHRVEHDFIGLNGGVMDQHACLLCKPDHFLLLDCLDLSYRHIPFTPHTSLTFFLIDTRVQHKLTESDYNIRAAECRRAMVLLHESLGVNSLREITLNDVRANSVLLGPTLTKRLEFVLEENLRVQNAVLAIGLQNWTALGAYLQFSHVGLRDNYEVSCAELDFLTAVVAQYPEILGARMMGGGFGGCTLNLSTRLPDASFVDEITTQYSHKFGIACTFIDVRLSDGARFEMLPQ